MTETKHDKKQNINGAKTKTGIDFMLLIQNEEMLFLQFSSNVEFL